MILLLYLDPGTGSLLLYAIIGIATTFLFFLKKLFSKLKIIIFGKGVSSNKHYGVVIHSEGTRYFSTFKNIIEDFIQHEIKLTYITSQKDDIAFSINSPYFEVICPGNEYQTYTFLNNLDADIVVSTTPHLDIYMWKKSKKVKKYIHIFHAPTSIDFYEKYALSFYDIIFSAVKQTESAQKYLDEKRNCNVKQYYSIGCPYLDDLIEQCKKIPRNNEIMTVLYAPSWGIRSSLNTNGRSIISTLLSKQIKVIFRPHPQSFISDKELLDSIIEEFKDQHNFCFDTNTSNLQSMVNSDALITDFSGILFDYKIIFNKPLFLASENLNINGYEIEDLPENLQFDIPYSNLYSKKLTDSVLKNIENELSDDASSEVSKDIIYNIGNASHIAFEKIVEIWKDIK